MPLTKVRYDMLDPEVTNKIKDAVSLSGAGSPFVFTTSGETKTLEKFKVDSDEKTIRTVAISNGILSITLASFSPTNVAATGQSLKWDQAASSFSVTANNPADFPEEYIENILFPLTAGTGTVSLAADKYTASQNNGAPAMPLSATGNIDTTFSLTNGGTIQPTITQTGGVWPATGGSASATVSFVKQDGITVHTTDEFTTNWEDVSHSISLAALSGKTFLKTYPSTTFSIVTNGLNTLTNANCTLTPTGGTATSPGANGTRTGTFTFTNEINKSNTGTTRKLSLSTVFSRPQAVTGTAYTHTPAQAAETDAISASFTYDSFTIWSDAKPVSGADTTKPSLSSIVDDNTGATGFSANVTLRGQHVKNLDTTVTNADQNNSRRFWLAVRKSAPQQPTSFQGGTPLANLTYETFELGLRPSDISDTTKWAGYVAEDYVFYGINIPAGQSVALLYS